MSQNRKNRGSSLDNTLQRFPVRKSELDRFKFGKRYYFQVAEYVDGRQPLCLDVACGAKPFPKADVLCDLHVAPVKARSMKCLVTNGKPFVLCSCYFLPFKTGAFDFATSYYLLEHLDFPGSFFRELKRVSKHGFIQCPTWVNELLYGEDVHNWLVFKRGNRLYVRQTGYGKQKFWVSCLFHRLYRSRTWQLLHAFVDEAFHVFTLTFRF